MPCGKIRGNISVSMWFRSTNNDIVKNSDGLKLVSIQQLTDAIRFGWFIAITTLLFLSSELNHRFTRSSNTAYSGPFWQTHRLLRFYKGPRLKPIFAWDQEISRYMGAFQKPPLKIIVSVWIRLWKKHQLLQISSSVEESNRA